MGGVALAEAGQAGAAGIGEFCQRGNLAGPAEVGDPLDAAQLPDRSLLDLSMLMDPPLDLRLDQRPQPSQVDQPSPVRRGGHRAPLEELRLAPVLDRPVRGLRAPGTASPSVPRVALLPPTAHP